MKVEKTPIDLDKRRYIVYDMDALYELDKVYGSIDRFFEVMKNMQDEDILNFLQAGLHEPLEQATSDFYENADVVGKLQIKLKILQAVTLCWPETDKSEITSASTSENEKVEWDWYWYFYMGTVLLNMSEADFWRSTPRKLYGLWARHKQYHGFDKIQEPQESAQDRAFVDAYM